jgi:tetratricopeptide (TPR) repeat protein
LLREAGRFEESLETCDRLASLRPDFLPIVVERMAALLRLGRVAEAGQAAVSILASSTNLAVSLIEPVRVAQAIANLRKVGQEGLAIEQADRMLKQLPPDSYVRGSVLAALDRWDEALPFLERTPTTVRYMFYWELMWDPYRDDPRFHQLMVRLGCEKAYEVARATQAGMLRKPAAKP